MGSEVASYHKHRLSPADQLMPVATADRARHLQGLPPPTSPSSATRACGSGRRATALAAVPGGVSWPHWRAECLAGQPGRGPLLRLFALHAGGACVPADDAGPAPPDVPGPAGVRQGGGLPRRAAVRGEHGRRRTAPPRNCRSRSWPGGGSRRRAGARAPAAQAGLVLRAQHPGAPQPDVARGGGPRYRLGDRSRGLRAHRLLVFARLPIDVAGPAPSWRRGPRALGICSSPCVSSARRRSSGSSR